MIKTIDILFQGQYFMRLGVEKNKNNISFLACDPTCFWAYASNSKIKEKKTLCDEILK